MIEYKDKRFCFNCSEFKEGKFFPYKGKRCFYEKEICAGCLDEFRGCKLCNSFFYPTELKEGTCFLCIQKSYKKLINNYTFKPADFFSPKGETLDNIFYGVEVEYESENYGEDTFNVFNLVKDFAVLKRDSSLEQGFEIVSFPAPLELHYTLWNNFFSNIPKSVKSFRTCGMHVHCSRHRLSSLQIGKMLFFIHDIENRKFIELIAGRKSNYQNDFETVKKVTDGKDGGMVPQNTERHTGLNLNGANTIEFRIFASPKDSKTLYKNIEFCKALIKFTECSMHSIEESKKNKVFCDFVARNRRDFPNLNNFLKKNKS